MITRQTTNRMTNAMLYALVWTVEIFNKKSLSIKSRAVNHWWRQTSADHPVQIVLHDDLMRS